MHKSMRVSIDRSIDSSTTVTMRHSRQPRYALLSSVHPICRSQPAAPMRSRTPTHVPGRRRIPPIISNESPLLLPQTPTPESIQPSGPEATTYP